MVRMCRIDREIYSLSRIQKHFGGLGAQTILEAEESLDEFGLEGCGESYRHIDG